MARLTLLAMNEARSHLTARSVDSVGRSVSLELVEKLPGSGVLLPVQTLGDLFSLLAREAMEGPHGHKPVCAQET